jgi:hypothetical protein
MTVRFQQRWQLSTRSSGAFTLGVVVTLLGMTVVVYLHTRPPRLGDEAEQYLGETDR